MELAYLLDDVGLVEGVVHVYAPEDCTVPHRGNPSRQVNLFATFNLREGLLDDLFVEDTLLDVLQKLLDPHVAWLKDTGAASRNEENDDLRMIVFHPVAKLL